MSVAGAWNITVNSPMGAQKSTLNFTLSDGVLSGNQSGAQGAAEIIDGKVEGDNVSWKSQITTPFPMTLEFSGAVDGDKISGNVKAGAFGSFPFSGERD